MSPHEPSRAPAGIPLKTHVEELRRRCEAVSRLQGGATYYAEELGIFRDYANEAGLIIPSAPDELKRPPDEEGNEHQVWYLPDTETVLKATWPDFFGLLVVHRPHEEHKASPIAYLERWQLHNELFGDQVAFIGAFQTDTGLRLLIRQPAIAATLPPEPGPLLPAPVLADLQRFLEAFPPDSSDWQGILDAVKGTVGFRIQPDILRNAIITYFGLND